MRRLALAIVTTTVLFIGGLGLQPASAAGYPPCTITGTAVNEIITGTEGNDVICTGGGNDTVNALGGDDIVIVTAPGVDTINAGSGNDTIDATLGTDTTIDAGSGDDTVYGSPGDDEIAAGYGNDSVTGGDGNDEILGGEGSDSITGSNGNDVISGEAGDDSLEGGEGSDTLNGTEGDDSLIGGEGNDILLGGSGFDALIGQGGNDKLNGGIGQDSLNGGSGKNTCTRDDLDVTDGCTVYVSFDIADTVSFSGVITDSFGAPLNGIMVALGSSDGASNGSCVDSQGAFSVEVPKGQYYLALGYWCGSSKPAGMPDFGLEGKVFSLLENKVVSLSLPEIHRIRVHVQDQNGKPLVGASSTGQSRVRSPMRDLGSGIQAVIESYPQGMSWASSTTDENGNFYLYSFDYGFPVTVQAYKGTLFLGTKTIEIVGEDSGIQTQFEVQYSTAPKNLTHSNLAGTSFSLGWGLPDSNGGSDITDYQVEVTSNGSNSWTVIPHAAFNSLGFNVTNLLPGRTYQFRVSAVTSAGVGAASNIITVTTLGAVGPNAPASLVVSGVKTTSASLSWPKVVATQKITNYLVDVSKDGSTWISVSKRVSTSTSLALSGLKLGTSYQVRVAAVNSVGTGAYVYGSFTTLATVSTAPTALVSSNLSSSGFTLNWTAPTSNGGAAITDYVVEINGGGFSWSPISHDITGNTSITVTGLNPGIKYSVRVKTVNRVGMSKTSTSLYVTTLPTAPGTVTGLTVKSVTATSAAITWTAPNTGGAKISDYLAEYSTDNGQTWKTVVKSASSSTSLTLKGLKTKTSYLIRITAKNSVGYGTSSLSLTVTTS